MEYDFSLTWINLSRYLALKTDYKKFLCPFNGCKAKKWLTDMRCWIFYSKNWIVCAKLNVVQVTRRKRTCENFTNARWHIIFDIYIYISICTHIYNIYMHAYIDICFNYRRGDFLFFHVHAPRVCESFFLCV